MVEWPNLAVPPKIGGTLFEVICEAGASGTLSHLLSSRSAPGGRGGAGAGEPLREREVPGLSEM